MKRRKGVTQNNEEGPTLVQLQKKKTNNNKTLKILNKVYFMKYFRFLKNKLTSKRNSQKTKLYFT